LCYCNGMQSKATGNNRLKRISINKRQSHAASFAKVFDGNKQPIRGLWVRNGRYYAQLKIEDPNTGEKKTRRVALLNKDGKGVQTVAEAKAEMARLQTQRADNNLPVLRRTSKFSEYAKQYLGCIEQTKKPGTVSKESGTLDTWIEYFKRVGLGDIRLDQVKRVHVNGFLDDRLKRGLGPKKGVAPRTANLDLIAFRNVLKRAIDDGLIQRLPTEGMRPFKTTTKKRTLFTTADLDKFCEAAFTTKENEDGKEVPLTKNAQELVDYVRLMAYCGARRNEALALRWEDVDFERKQLTVGASGDTKNRTSRVVDFNPKLEAHLKAMQRRRAPDTQWLFPSPQRGEKDVPLKVFRESLELVRVKAGLPNFQFHDCRHHFISMCVMSGVDFMTIAAWVGHLDGGVLIGKVYGHLANEHRKLMAGRVAFEPVMLETPKQLELAGA
jgi:integrase